MTLETVEDTPAHRGARGGVKRSIGMRTLVAKIVSSTAAALCVALVSTSARADAIRVSTPRGAAIEVLEDKPDGAGPFPAVVLASGSHYPMRSAILERVARSLVADGVAVFRFDWAYSVKDPVHGSQSKDRVPEIEDMTAVLNLARS